MKQKLVFLKICNLLNICDMDKLKLTQTESIQVQVHVLMKDNSEISLQCPLCLFPVSRPFFFF